MGKMLCIRDFIVLSFVPSHCVPETVLDPGTYQQMEMSSLIAWISQISRGREDIE